jgi:hypothetical protein
MKRKIILPIALVLSLTILLLTSSDSSVTAQNQLKIFADTGLITLGPNQELRLSVLSGTPTANGSFNFRVRRTTYAQEACADGVCKQSIESQNTSDVMTVLPGEAASISIRRCVSPICGGVYVRGAVLSDSRDVRVNASIIDTVTGEVVAFTTDLIIDVSGN